MRHFQAYITELSCKNVASASKAAITRQKCQIPSSASLNALHSILPKPRVGLKIFSRDVVKLGFHQSDRKNNI